MQKTKLSRVIINILLGTENDVQNTPKTQFQANNVDN